MSETTAPAPVAMDVPVDPHYHTSTYIEVAGKGRHLAVEKPCDDPFATITVTLGWRDMVRGLWSALRRRQPAVKVQTSVGGDWDAMKHVMTVRPLHAMLPPDQAAARAVDEAFAEEPDDLALRRGRDQPHTLWYWVDDPNDPIPAPHSTTLDTADEAEAAARRLVASWAHNAEMDEKPNALAWVKVFRADNENYETYRWERPA